MSPKPYVWQMIKEAVENLGGKATYSEIKDYIRNKYGEVNESTITCQIIVCTVNHPSRIHYLENIAKNIDAITVNGHRLKLYVDENGRDGVEYPTDVGPIDILAVDEKGNFVVFELKLSRGADKAMGQISRYMGWVKQNLAEDKGVKGVIAAKKVDEKLKYAASIIPVLSLFEYELNFKIEGVSI